MSDEPPDLRHGVALECAAQVLNILSEDKPPMEKLAAATYLVLESMYRAEILIEEWRTDVAEQSTG